MKWWKLLGIFGSFLSSYSIAGISPIDFVQPYKDKFPDHI